MNYIDYGIGKDYLKHWGVQEALREIYQNYLDYGDYTETVISISKNKCKVTLTNDFVPDNFEFLRIGKSMKSSNSIGKYGEGLKMASLVFKRNNIPFRILTKGLKFTPTWRKSIVGRVFSLAYVDYPTEECFVVEIEINKVDFYKFVNNIIKEEDKLFSSHHGDIVDRPKGKIYSGGLFVCKLDNMSKAYNIRPDYLPLDRDRSVPRAFDVSWAASKINSKYQWSLNDLENSDTQYLEEVPEEKLKEFKPKKVGDNIEFLYKTPEGEKKVLKNDSVKRILTGHNFFKEAIAKIKRFAAKSLGIYDMLLEFERKHVHSSEAKSDFKLILERIEKSKKYGTPE